MRVRPLLNRHPAATVAVVLVFTALAVASIVLQMRPSGELSVLPRKEFYTADDGETWFVDEVDKITPFDHGGRPAVLLHLYTCDGGKTQFVGYLERLPDGAADQYRSRTRLPATAVPESDDVAALVGSLVKRKGDAEWVSSGDKERYQQIVSVRCPDGSNNAVRLAAR